MTIPSDDIERMFEPLREKLTHAELLAQYQDLNLRFKRSEHQTSVLKIYRAEYLIFMRSEGVPISAIATVMGISHQRVSQMISRIKQKGLT